MSDQPALNGAGGLLPVLATTNTEIAARLDEHARHAARRLLGEH